MGLEGIVSKRADAPYRSGRRSAERPLFAESARLERDDFSSNRHHALTYSWSMIFSENRYPLFGIML
jgi:hypothetical protein